MTAAPVKLCKPRMKTQQSNISHFDLTKLSGEANANAISNKTNGKDEAEARKNEPILAAINGLKTGFSNRFEGVMAAIEGVRKEIGECT